MAYNDKIGRGSLGSSRHQNNPNSPSHVGSITLDGPVAAGEKLYLAAWIKSDDRGQKFLSIVVERPSNQPRQMGQSNQHNYSSRQQQQSGYPQHQNGPTTTRFAPQPKRNDMDDEIPF